MSDDNSTPPSTHLQPGNGLGSAEEHRVLAESARKEAEAFRVRAAEQRSLSEALRLWEISFRPEYRSWKSVE